MKVLVTGAAGFIGSHLCERLVGLGHEVVGLDAFTPYYSRVLKELNAADVSSKGVGIHELDLAIDDLSEAVKEIGIVYHLAAQPGISSSTPFSDYVKNNIIATHRLLEAVETSSTLQFFINVGTSSIYGLDATKSEDATPEPASFYGVTKLAAEQLVLARQRDGMMSACSMRLFSVYGERERPEKLYPRLYRSILSDYKFPYYEGSESHLRSYTYVGDIVDGLVSVLDNFDDCNGQIFNLGLDQTITTGEAIKIVEEVMEATVKYELKPRRPGDQYVTLANIEKARKLLNYDPKTSPRDGFFRAGKWYKEKILPLLLNGKLE